MPDFSTILQSPDIRAIVQEGSLERAFHDALFPLCLFRDEAAPSPWPDGVGDTQIFTAKGLMEVDCQPLGPTADPEPDTFPVEQWTAQLNRYSKTIDTHMPTSIVAIASLFLSNGQTLGLHAAQTINRVARNRLYAAALSGQTVCDTTVSGASTVHVERINGFTRSRIWDTGTGTNKVRFEAVSSSNPLAVQIYDSNLASVVSCNVIGCTPDTRGDEYGPGSLLLSTTVTTDSATRVSWIHATDATYIKRPGGGNSVADITTSDIPTLADCRDLVANMRINNVPSHPDNRYHCHLDPISESKIFLDSEFKLLHTALPDYYSYKDFALGEVLGTVFIRNNECPVASSVVGGRTATYSQKDPFPGVLFSTNATTGVAIHRMLFTGQAAIMEHYQDQSALITDAGITGKRGEFQVTNNGIDVLTDRIMLIIRAPLNRTQDKVASTWLLAADFPMRTDASTGDASRYKRVGCIEHG